MIAFARFAADGSPLVCAVNFSPIVREGYRVGLPRGGAWREVLNTDAVAYGGSRAGQRRLGHGRGAALERAAVVGVELTLPPLAAIWLVPA